MRESRTYGSGRGACDETHVPTATCFCCVATLNWHILHMAFLPAACPQPAEADMRPPREDAAFDSLLTSDVQCNRLSGCRTASIHTGREIGYPAIIPSLAVPGCSSIN
jgi:hypothetical protein